MSLPVRFPVAALAGLALAAPALTLHVAPGGRDDGDGSESRPYGSLARARDRLRGERRAGGAEAGAVLVHGGRFAATNTLALGREDAGTAGAPVVWRAAPGEQPVLDGGIRIAGFHAVTEAALRAALPAAVRDRVLQAEVAPGPPLLLGGFGSGRGFRTHPAPELFFNGRALPRAGWPDDGFARVSAVNTNVAPVLTHGLRGSREGVLRFDDPRLARWADEPALWLHGYWFWDWSDSYECVARVDPARGALTLAPPLHTYGYRAGQPFRVLNARSELDQPGEWHLDAARGVLLLLPPSDPAHAEVVLSQLAAPFVSVTGASNLLIEGLTCEYGAGDGLLVDDARGVTIRRCTVRRGGGDGILVRGGASNAVLACEVYDMGRGGVVVQGGDRRALMPGGHVVADCTMHDLSRVDRTYTPGILVGGVGQRIVHNEIYGVPSSALRVGGNDHLVAHNHIHHVVTESDDQGGVDLWGDPTFRGLVYRDNYFHDIGTARNGGAEVKLGQAAIRLDDAISGVRIEGNRFERCGAGGRGFGAVQIHGGKDNVIERNLFVDCAAAVSFSRWDMARWTNFVAGRLAKGDLDAARYVARYPALAGLEREPNTAVFRSNVLVRTPLRFLRGHDAVTDEGSEVRDDAAAPAVAPGAYGPRR